MVKVSDDESVRGRSALASPPLTILGRESVASRSPASHISLVGPQEAQHQASDDLSKINTNIVNLKVTDIITSQSHRQSAGGKQTKIKDKSQSELCELFPARCIFIFIHY